MILVDSNVIIDVLTGDPTWQAWSEAALSDAADRDDVAINPIIYAEVASGFPTMHDLDRHLGPAAFRRLPLPYEAGFIGLLDAPSGFGGFRLRVETPSPCLPVPALCSCSTDRRVASCAQWCSGCG
jgi:hypothetical protein